MDLFDLVGALLIGASQRRSRREELATSVAFCFAPLTEITLILLLDLHEYPYVALGALPATFAILSYILGRGLRLRSSSVIRMALLSAVLCVLVGLPTLMLTAVFAGL